MPASRVPDEAGGDGKHLHDQHRISACPRRAIGRSRPPQTDTIVTTKNVTTISDGTGGTTRKKRTSSRTIAFTRGTPTDSLTAPLVTDFTHAGHRLRDGDWIGSVCRKYAFERVIADAKHLTGAALVAGLHRSYTALAYRLAHARIDPSAARSCAATSV
jgi:hypothetical protein